MPLTKPLLNNCLIEVVKDYEGVSRHEENESLSSGVFIDYHLEQFHITASAGIELHGAYIKAKMAELEKLKGKTVRWEQYAEGGQTFEEDGKIYALVPWWRLISYQLEE